MRFHVIEPFPIAKISIDLVVIVEGVTKTEIVCVISDPSVKLIIVDIGGRALYRGLASGGVGLFRSGSLRRGSVRAW